MCGIFGFVGGLPADKAESCLHTLAHRGPDGWGLWSGEGVTLGHRRLSILDLSERGKQPMASPDGRYWITFNGEIYNFVEIREELAGRYAFRSDSDTEVILAAFAEWGEECLTRFNGMWAFAIWDAHKRRLFLARDRFGKKPLFYAKLPSGFAFASEMKALFPLLDSVSPDEVLIRDSRRMFTYESTSDCLIKGIRRFPAGHSGWLAEGELRTRRWWNTLDHLPEVPRRYEDQVATFRALFLDACRIRMRSDVPLGTALSGGLDSSATISAMALVARNGGGARIGGSWQHAFVASFPGSPIDEATYAKQVTDHLGIPIQVLAIDPLAAIGSLDRYYRLFEDLYITSPIPFMLTYGAIKAGGITVTLDGHGADELFGGYSFDYIHALRDAGPHLGKSMDVLDTYYESFPKEGTQFAGLPPKAIFLLRWHTRNVARMLLGRARVASAEATHPRWRDLDHLTRVLYVSAHETVLPTLLRNYDRYAMANGVEIRMPFMDHRIVSFASALPWTSKIRGGFSKAIVRDAVADLMPSAIAYRKTKIGFNSPVVDWMKGPLKPFILDLIASTSFRSCSLIKPDRVASMLRAVIDRPDATFHMGEAAWTALTPYLWERAVLKGEAFA